MLELPLQWHSYSFKSIFPSNLIYGYRSGQCNNSYNIYATNFTDLWIESLTKEQVLHKAIRYGLEGLGDSQIEELLSILNSSIDNSSVQNEITFNLPNMNNNTIQIDIQTDSLKWSFTLIKQSPQVLIGMLAQLNYQQFSNVNYLLFKLKEFENIIKSKDYYARFLSENFKSSHGNELIRKFKKNNPLDAIYLEVYDEAKWNTNIKESYSKMLNHHEDQHTPISLWSFINKSIDNRELWSFSNSYELTEHRLNNSATSSDLIKKEISIEEKSPTSDPPKRSRRPKGPSRYNSLGSYPSPKIPKFNNEINDYPVLDLRHHTELEDSNDVSTAESINMKTNKASTQRVIKKLGVIRSPRKKK